MLQKEKKNHHRLYDVTHADADDVSITPHAQENMNTTISELTVLAEDNNVIPYDSSIKTSLFANSVFMFD